MDNKLDLVVSFDTTGSMYPVLAQVRQEIEDFVKDMFTEFTDLRLGVIAHGDYCDEGDPYTIRVMDLTRDEEKLCRFVRETDKTYGGDADECYELVLNTARKVVNWREDAQHVLIMIGDASPHGVHYPQNKEHLDWKEEAKQLGKEDVKIFSVHALAYYRSSSRGFYKAIAELSGGVYLTLDQFNEIVELIKATCYQQGGEEKLNEYISIIRDNGKMTHSMDRNFRRLKGEKVEDTYERGSRYTTRHKDDSVTLKDMGKLEPVMPGRFQTFTVPQNIDIKGYVTSMGIEFKKGRGFYELSKAETVQQYKEVIIQDRETGEMFTGSQVREELGLQPQTVSGGVKERLHKSAAEKYRVFVQSTSVNRKLIAGTTFLYEVSDIEDTGTIIKEEEIMLKDATVESYGIEEEKEIKKSSKKGEETKKSKKKSEKKKEETKKKDSKKEAPKKESSKKDTPKKEKSSKSGVSALSKNFEVNAARLVTQFDKVSDAINRYTASQNKKNTTFAKNNIKKLIELANKLDSKIEE